MGKYLYSVVPAEAVDKLALEVEGIDGADVYPVVEGSMAAIVSDIESSELRPERKNLSAHSAVMRKVMDQTNLLPVAFGIVAKNERDLRGLLAEYGSEMREQLDTVDGKVEMGLRGLLQVSNPFDYFIEKFPDLKKQRDETFAGGEASREDKMELGQMFSELLEQFQDESADSAVARLESVGQVRVNEPRSEEEVLNLAVLVPRDKLEAFSDAVEKLAPDLDDRIELQVTGPWPPYNFVDLRIESVVEEGEEGEEAR